MEGWAGWVPDRVPELFMEWFTFEWVLGIGPVDFTEVWLPVGGRRCWAYRATWVQLAGETAG